MLTQTTPTPIVATHTEYRKATGTTIVWKSFLLLYQDAPSCANSCIYTEAPYGRILDFKQQSTANAYNCDTLFPTLHLVSTTSSRRLPFLRVFLVQR
jgi:hypothetical protein